MPCAAADAMSSGLSCRARMPPWTFGWSVFKRPSIISGKPVYCGDVADGDALLLEVLPRAAGAVDFNPGRGQAAGKAAESQFVAYAHQRTSNAR